MKYIKLFLPIFFLLATPVQAASTSAKDSFDKINNCVKNNDSQGCKDLVTASSSDLYNRFMSYGLVGCLPKDAEFISQENIGNDVMIRAGVVDNGNARTMRLIFTQEEGQWKLDTPQSLRRAMGKNWEQQIELVEQLYLLMKQQFGSKLDCKTIRGLVNVKKK
jgi:hypothetical protein